MPKQKHFLRGKRIAFDTETTGLKPWHGDRPFGFSFCNEEMETAYFEWPVDPWTRKVKPRKRELYHIKRLLLDPEIAIIMHNAKFDVRMIEMFGVRMCVNGKLVAPIHETMFMAHVANSLEHNYKLKRLADVYLGIDDSDQKALKKLVVRLRNLAKKEGWKIHRYEEHMPDGKVKIHSSVETDYWLPLAAKRYHPEWLNDGEVNLCEQYAVLDAVRTMQLFLLYDQILRDEKSYHIYENELELWPVTYEMEGRGVAFDVPRARLEEKNAIKEERETIREIEKASWKGINIDRPKDLKKLFYEKRYLNLPVLLRTAKTSQPATNINAMQAHLDNPIIKSIIKARSAHKSWSTFFRAYRKLALPDPLQQNNGYAIHTDFQQVGPRTARYASRTPNLQNVADALASRSLAPIQARTPFVPRPGYTWYHVDGDQLEVRIFTDVAQEPTMLDAIKHGRDLHTECALRAWGGKNERCINMAMHALQLDGSQLRTEPPGKLIETWNDLGIKQSTLKRGGYDIKKLRHIATDWIETFDYNIVDAEKSVSKKNSRSRAKMLLFARFFGGGINSVMNRVQVTYETAAAFVADYDRAFPRINEYIAYLKAEAKRNGFITTRYGRKLMVPQDKTYVCVNYMVQGSAADFLKRAMVRADRICRESGLDAHIVMTIHDEIVFEIANKHAHRSLIMKLCRSMADNEGHFTIPTPVSIEKVTNNWSEKKKVRWCTESIYTDTKIKGI